MDRNIAFMLIVIFPFVALRKESVDRNECDWKLVDGVP